MSKVISCLPLFLFMSCGSPDTLRFAELQDVSSFGSNRWEDADLVLLGRFRGSRDLGLRRAVYWEHGQSRSGEFSLRALIFESIRVFKGQFPEGQVEVLNYEGLGRFPSISFKPGDRALVFADRKQDGTYRGTLDFGSAFKRILCQENELARIVILPDCWPPWEGMLSQERAYEYRIIWGASILGKQEMYRTFYSLVAERAELKHHLCTFLAWFHTDERTLKEKLKMGLLSSEDLILLTCDPDPSVRSLAIAQVGRPIPCVPCP